MHSYEFAKKLVDAGVPILERRCWEVCQVQDGDKLVPAAAGCGATIRFILGNPIICPFCGTCYMYAPRGLSKSYFEIYPLTDNYTDTPPALTEDEQGLVEMNRNQFFSAVMGVAKKGLVH